MIQCLCRINLRIETRIGTWIEILTCSTVKRDEDACPCILYFYIIRNASSASVERPHFELYASG